MLESMRRCLLAATCLLAAPQAAQAAEPPPSPRQHLAFYLPPHPLPPGGPGDVILAHRIPSPIGRAGRMTLLLYRSVDQLGHPTAVSGTLLEPAGQPPKGGWPLISWAHGTTGIADRCAPSRTASAPTSPIVQEIDSWVRRGYAIASTDYAGLGTPPAHAYLMGRAEGRNVIDIARAARHLDRRINRNWVAAGHSQGGQAALFAGAQADSRAPDLRLRGVLAFAPASHIGELARGARVLTSPSPLSAYAALILQGAATGDHALNLAEIESPAALALRPLIQQQCVSDLEKPQAYGSLSPAAIFRPGANLRRLYQVLDAQNPALRIPEPIRLVQGDADTTVPKPLTDQLAGELKTKHDRLDYTTVAGAGHVQVVAAAKTAALRWLKRRLPTQHQAH